ncbi:MAG: restriction endonuclease subunit S [Gammaproteobacteria bacterium]
MLEGLKPYPAMKDSGVPWLGKVPKHWEVGTLRRKLRPYDGIKIGPFGSQLKLDQMSASGFKVYGQANVIAGDFARGTKFVDKQKFDELSAYEVRSHDLVVTMMGTSGRCACVPETAAPGIMDSHLLRLRVDASIDVSFAALVIDQGPYVKEQISVAGKGSIMQGLNSGMVKDLVLALPPLPEQAAIVRFLDHADRRIRRYIRAKQKLIKLLEEQKQAIIHRAVTRGLDPTNSPGANLNADQQAGGPKSEGRESPSSVRLKPSGVEWLGDVPEHWSLKRFKFLARVTSGQVDPRKPEHRGKTLVAPNHIKSGTGKITDHETADEQGADSGKYEVRQGQIIYSKIRPNLRKAAIASVDCLCSADMYPIAVRETELRPAYLLLLLLSAPFTKYAVDCSLRVAMPQG